MFDRNIHFFSECLFCLSLTLIIGCTSKIGDDWKKVSAKITTDSATGVTTAVVSGLEKGTDYEFRLSAVSQADSTASMFDAIVIGTKTEAVNESIGIEFKVANKTDNSVTVTWDEDIKVNTKSQDASEVDEIKLKVANKTDNSVTLTWDKNILIDANAEKNSEVDKIEFRIAGKKDDSITLTWKNNNAWTFKVEGRKSAPPPAPKPEVIVDSVSMEDVQIYIYTDGTTVAYNSVDIRARVSGYLEKLFFQPGAIVKAGDRLALIEQDSYKIALDAAEAELSNAKAQAMLAKANEARSKVLFERGTITTEEYQTHLAAYDMALAAVERANAAIHNAELNLQYTDLYSPITGKTTKLQVDVGNFVSPTGAQAVLLSITQLDPMYVEFKLSDRQYSELKDRIGFRDAFNKAVTLLEEDSQTENDASQPLALTGMPVDISLMTGMDVFRFDFNIPGKTVTLVDNQINSETAQITLRAEVQNPLLKTDNANDFMIYAGHACRVRIPYETVKDAVLIREEAILTDLDTKYVLVVGRAMYQPTDTSGNPLEDKDGNVIAPYETDVVQRRDIAIGRLLDTQMRIILDDPLKPGVKPGESYIVQGIQRVRIGMEVKPTTLEEYTIRRSAEKAKR